MPTVQSLSVTGNAHASAAGTARVAFQNTIAGHTWHVRLVTASSNMAEVTVARNGAQIIDSTKDDPRPDVTSDSQYDLAQMESVVVSWANVPTGTYLEATLTYDDEWI